MLYLDANATSRLRACAAQALKELSEADLSLRNPSSIHSGGRRARMALERAREKVLNFILPGGAKADLIFTSGGTESCATMLGGFLGANISGAHIISSTIEHPAILEPLKHYARLGAEVVFINPKNNGIISVEKYLAAIRSDTALVALMAANNETGAIQPVLELAQALRKQGFRGAIVSDCTQAVLKSNLSFDQLFAAGVNAISISGHKLGAPAGIGALLINNQTSTCFEFLPLLRGGPQENRFRAGTENLFGAVALGAVAEELAKTAAAERSRISTLRELLWSKISSLVPAVTRLTPDFSNAISNTLMLNVPGCRGDDLVVALDLSLLSASTGSACASGKQEVSHVLHAMGLSPESAREVVRLSLDWDINEADVRRAADIFSRTVNSMRSATDDRPLAVGE